MRCNSPRAKCQVRSHCPTLYALHDELGSACVEYARHWKPVSVRVAHRRRLVCGVTAFTITF
jgi:hypothetical protein